MTIAAVWQEEGHLWCAADTRLVVGAKDQPTTEIGSKIYAIPMAISAVSPADGSVRRPHFWTQYGFVYAGAALPASMTAVTAATLLQKLVRPGNQVVQPMFEEIAELVFRLAKRFTLERRRFDADGLFSAAFFGWCGHKQEYLVAHIEGQDRGGDWQVQLSFPRKPEADGAPWLVLGGASAIFNAMHKSWGDAPDDATKLIPRQVIEKMVAQGVDPTVGGATSVGVADEFGFELFHGLEQSGHDDAVRRVFNGLDLDAEIGEVGQYQIGIRGLP